MTFLPQCYIYVSFQYLSMHKHRWSNVPIILFWFFQWMVFHEHSLSTYLARVYWMLSRCQALARHEEDKWEPGVGGIFYLSVFQYCHLIDHFNGSCVTSPPSVCFSPWGFRTLNHFSLWVWKWESFPWVCLLLSGRTRVSPAERGKHKVRGGAAPTAWGERKQFPPRAVRPVPVSAMCQGFIDFHSLYRF